MSFNFLDKLNLLKERETYANVKSNINKSSVAEGTNLWILFFAILIASLGLNTNSTAVVIGAMLISPLIGPIVGLGFGVATNDFKLIKTATISYLFSTGVGLFASTVYFLITPIDEAHSELLARISPDIYDVLIAFFGGFAGVIAISSKQKGNVIPGVAIATAIMPPLCTAGYGIATLQSHFFFGAFYLFLINSVFIFAATIITTHYMRFRQKKYEDPSLEKRAKFIIWGIIVVTLIPSVYLSYTLIQKENFVKDAEKFIKEEAYFHNNFLLKKEILPNTKEIILTFGGRIISEEEKIELNKKLKYYAIKDSKLTIQNGFSFDKDRIENSEDNSVNSALTESALENQRLRYQLDSIASQKELVKDVFKELKVLFPEVENGLIQPVSLPVDSTNKTILSYLTVLNCTKNLDQTKKRQLETWMKERLNAEKIEIVIQNKK